MIKVYDTSAALDLQESIFDSFFVISQVTLEEIEEIKKSSRKDFEIKHKARCLAKLLTERQDKYEVIPRYQDIMLCYLCDFKGLDGFNDNIIVASAYYYQELHQEPIVLVTNDINMAFISSKIFGLKTEIATSTEVDEYVGYKIVNMSEEEMSYFYSNTKENIYNLHINEYLLINNSDGINIDTYRWNGEEHVQVLFKPFPSKQFGKVKPLDPIQKCAFDSIDNNDITVLFGKAGSGKTTIPISYFMSKLEKGKIKKCYFVYSFEPLKNAKTLGYEKGDHITKLLYSASIGNILASKFGDLVDVERLIEDGKIDIIPTANIRGVEFEADSMVIVSEVQNIDVYTLKTIIQRCKEGCKQVYEGDIIEQTDVALLKPGMFRMIEVFKGTHVFGCVKLKNNYRSSIGKIADKM